jgi:hypothetical protein
MSRPRKTGLEFFPHDTDLSSDLKIEAVEAVHGIAGYGVYLKLLEIIYHEGKSPDLKAPATALALAGRCHISIDQFNAILQTCVEVGLFEREAFEAGRLDSNGIRSRSGYVEERRESAKQRQDKWRKEHVTTPDVTSNKPQEEGLSRVITPEKGIVTRDNATNVNVNVNKENIKRDVRETHPDTGASSNASLELPLEASSPPPREKRFRPPTADEVGLYCAKRGNKIDPQRFVDFYTSKGWKVGSSPMKDWQSAVRNWERNDRKESAGPPLKVAQRSAFLEMGA